MLPEEPSITAKNDPAAFISTTLLEYVRRIALQAPAGLGLWLRAQRRRSSVPSCTKGFFSVV